MHAPVSNSRRFTTILREFTAERDQPWMVEMVEVMHDPDKALVASADLQIMDGAPGTWQLARETVEGMWPRRSILDLTSEERPLRPKKDDLG